MRIGQKHSEETKSKMAAKARLRRGVNAAHWKGGKMVVGNYIYVLSPDHPNKTSTGYVAEHRLVIEKKLGRYLEKSEAVHHIDGNTKNNKVDNLLLYKTNGYHTAKEHVKRNKLGQFTA